MIDSALAAIASSRVYVSPITLLLCIIVLPGVVALAVLSYVYSKEAKQEEEQEDEEQHAALARSVSTRRWFAERYVPCALERALLHSIPLCAFTSAMAEHVRSSSCVVCLAPFQVAELLKVLPPCQHAFHVACIDKWFDSNSTCPICRCQVSTPSENAVQPHQDITLDIMVT